MTAVATQVHELDPEEFYRSDDMALVTYLKMQGHAVQQLDWRADICFWVFRVTDALLDATEEFLAGDSRVDPREYSRLYSRTKKEFYDSKDRNRR